QANPFPEIRVYTSTGSQYVEFGPEANSQQNALDQDQIAITDDLTFFLGDHVLTVGTHNEIYRFNNLFLPNAFGYYQFRDVQALRDSTPSFYRVSYANIAATGGNETPRANWSMMQNGLYIQDDWNVFKNFRINMGIRGDIPLYFDEPYRNELFSKRFDSLAAIYSVLPDSLKKLRTEIPSGLSTSNLPQSRIMWSPRLGFNWDISGDRTFQLRGGTGIFTGRVAAVWLSNQYSNTGVDIFRAEVGVVNSSSANPITDPVTGLPVRFSLDPNNPPVPGDPGFPGAPVATTAINLTDRNFTMPQVWRNTLGFDFEVLPGITATLEGMYSKQLNQVDFQNLNLRRSSTMPTSPVDGRPLYATNRQDSLNAREFTQVLVLKSRSEGYQYSLLSQLALSPNNPFLKGLSATLAYTNSAAYDINAGTNSTANSLWTGTSVSDPNNTQIGRSNFDVTHRILANLSYRVEIFKSFPTTFGVYYSGNSGRPYSLTYGRGAGNNNDANGDGVTFNDLIYVPNREDLGTKIVMETDGSTDLRTQDEIWAQFMSYIDNNDALRDFRGKIVERNSARAPWINQLDLRIAQSFPSFGNQSIEFTLDIQNLLNLLNPDWGIQKYMQFTNIGVVGFRGYDAQDRMRLTFADPDEFLTADTFFSRWRMQLGARYNF
ncbi:MAG TPA: hypothetical protein VEC36_02060, partial [Patescibacteria group bacterium]|nr:hypothetical protein [Patescibacteria group bacterium]